jgi:hypothetical protein
MYNINNVVAAGPDTHSGQWKETGAEATATVEAVSPQGRKRWGGGVDAEKAWIYAVRIS